MLGQINLPRWSKFAKEKTENPLLKSRYFRKFKKMANSSYKFIKSFLINFCIIFAVVTLCNDFLNKFLGTGLVLGELEKSVGLLILSFILTYSKSNLTAQTLSNSSLQKN